MEDKSDCVFCKIVDGTLASLRIFEDDQFIAFLDKYPRATGHCQIIPKQHFRWVWDVPAIGLFMENARKVANAQRKAFGTDMVISHILGDEVPHAHIWLIPQGHKKNTHLKGEELAQLIRNCF